MKKSDFYYDLPQNQIAQTPADPRDSARMMVYDRKTQKSSDHFFYELPDFLRSGDALVINDTKVIPARLLGVKEATGAAVEVLLLKRLSVDRWEALVRPGKKLPEGTQIVFGEGLLTAQIEERTSAGGRVVCFTFEGVFEELLNRLGEMPLPPYIHEKLHHPEEYQTIYAKTPGSAAAPTAGLHFTERVFDALRQKNVQIVPVLLHVGLGTFRPVKEENIEDHLMHEEYVEVTQDAADRLNAVHRAGGRVICAGTTSLRALESAADEEGIVHPLQGETDIFITPGYSFKATDGLMTNFHLPESTLLMLVSALMGRENALQCYREAVHKQYRFFSFGDCMLIE